MSDQLSIMVWNEFIHEQTNEQVKELYPQGIHGVLREMLAQQFSNATVRTATLDEADHGLNEAVLKDTDVLLWWGHAAHDRVEDRIVQRVQQRVLEGMGLICLHSAHASKIFRTMLGTSCMLRWREAAERERLWVVDPSHPIVEGVDGEYFELPHTEMYGEFFDIPAPDELVLISWFEGGEVFRSGCVFRRGKGKVFYFRPGHETFPIYYDDNVQRIIANGVKYVRPSGSPYFGNGRNIPESLEKIDAEHQVDASLHEEK